MNETCLQCTDKTTHLRLASDQCVVPSTFGGNFSGLLDHTVPLFTLVGDAEPKGLVLEPS